MVESSFSFPNLFDVSRNKVNLYTDSRSIVSRVRLLMLTEPTEMYMCPDFGVGLKKFLFTYNNDNTIALIRDKLIEQLRKWEPSVQADQTKVTRGLDYTELDSESTAGSINKLSLTITLTMNNMQTVSFGISAEDIK